MTWEDAVAYALAYNGAALATHYGQPAVKANGRALLNVGREADSFVLHLDQSVIEALMDTHPETFWKTPHYEGYPAVLVRHDTPHDDLVRELIESACSRVRAMKQPRPRKAK